LFLEEVTTGEAAELKEARIGTESRVRALQPHTHFPPRLYDLLTYLTRSNAVNHLLSKSSDHRHLRFVTFGLGASRRLGLGVSQLSRQHGECRNMSSFSRVSSPISRFAVLGIVHSRLTFPRFPQFQARTDGLEPQLKAVISSEFHTVTGVPKRGSWVDGCYAN